MKKLILLAFAAFTLFSCSDEKRIVGTWFFASSDCPSVYNVESLTFTDDEFFIEGATIGNPYTIENGFVCHDGVCVMEIDVSKNKLSITYTNEPCTVEYTR